MLYQILVDSAFTPVAMKKKSSRYDLPNSRVLIRSLRYRDSRVGSILGEDASAEERERVENDILDMVIDLFTCRLLEDRHFLVDRYLCGGKRARELDPGEAIERLRATNEWVGWDLFHVDLWDKYGPGEELTELENELHLSRFWPPGVPTEILGALWEERLPVTKRAGVFYSPKRIVNMVLSGSLETLLEERGGVDEAFVLDPACGTGYFLIEAYRRLCDRELGRIRLKGDLFAPVLRGESGAQVLDPVRRMEIFRDHLFGLDLDEGALELAKRALYIETVADVAAFRSPVPPADFIEGNLVCGDALLDEGLPQQVDLFDPDSPPALRPFDWYDSSTRIGEVMEGGGFNCIVGNPPWVSLKGRHRQAPYSPRVVTRLIEKYGADTYRPNLVEFFIRRSLELLEEGGLHSFVVPDRIAENEQYQPLRAHMSDLGEMVRLHFREPFPGVAADTLIYVFQKRAKPRRTAKILMTDVEGMKRSVPQSYWTKGESFHPGDEVPDDVERVLRKIESAGRRKFSDFMETGVGFIAKPQRITVEKTLETQSAVVKGEHVVPYRRVGLAWFEFSLGNLAGGTRSLKKLTAPDRILIRKTGARLVAAIDHSGDFPEQSLYFAFPKDRRLVKPYDLRFFLGLLNSRVMSFYFRHRKITNRSTTPQIKKVHLDTLPVRPINFNDDRMKELHQKLADMVAARESAPPEREDGLDREIDALVAELFDLDEADMEVVLSS